MQAKKRLEGHRDIFGQFLISYNIPSFTQASEKRSNRPSAEVRWIYQGRNSFPK